MAEGDTFVNALLGAVVTMVLAPFIPFAPILGGGVAGYLQGGDSGDSLRVGAVSGGIALVPLVLFALFLTQFLFFFMGNMMGIPGFVGQFGAVILVIGLVFAILYTVGLSALGGWLGNYVRYETDIGD